MQFNDAMQARICYDGTWYAGFLLGDLDVVMFADDGVVMPLTTPEIEHVMPFETWIDVSPEVLGDEPARPTKEEFDKWLGRD